MKKNQVNMILVDQTKRRNKILSYSLVIVIMSVLTFSFVVLFLTENNPEYVKYYEKSKLDYKVYLKENEFFGNNYLTSNNQYIASLIDYINAEFNYDLEVLEKDIDYKYSYKIDADVIVKEKGSDKNIYQRKDNLIDKGLNTSNSSSKVSINETVKINYHYYNDLIKKFISIYSLDDIESTLNISMYVTVLGKCEDIEDADTESVINLLIPLTTKTVGIDMKYDLVDEDQEKLMICNVTSGKGFQYIIVGIIFLIIDVVLIVKLVLYVIATRSAETIYDRELKKILNNYKSYIQKVNNSFEFDGYDLIKVDSFTDMLEIRDTINQPILMVENKNKNGVFFLIPSTTKLLYTYCLKVSDIKYKMEEKKNEEAF